jgi:hypothetical protein
MLLKDLKASKYDDSNGWVSVVYKSPSGRSLGRIVKDSALPTGHVLLDSQGNVFVCKIEPIMGKRLANAFNHLIELNAATDDPFK